MRETRWINSLIVLPKSSIDVVCNPCVIKPITTFKDVNKIIVDERHTFNALKVINHSSKPQNYSMLVKSEILFSR